MSVDVVDCLRTKRDGGELTDEQVDALVAAHTDGTAAPEQMAAFCMAVVHHGMSPRELSRWTAAMVASGRRLDLSGVGRPTVDKHSTGGVGDGTSLVVVPLVAACGAAVPQLSGRGLGHTGGTLDKLEAVPGFRSALSHDELVAVLRDVGGVVAAAGPDLAPADRSLYALRDVTATVESVPLIASSIMSKKIAEGTSALVLDVKVGSGAFLPDEGAARELAGVMVGLGEAAGVRTVALLTDIEHPLGRAAGNALEVQQALDVLAGGGPEDFRALCLALAREMVAAAGLDPDAARSDPGRVLAGGGARDVWDAMVRAQGGDPDAVLPTASVTDEVRAERDGVLARLDARAVGVAAWRLGAGRARKEDDVSPVAGVTWTAAVGERVSRGQPLLRLHAATDAPQRRLDRAREALAGAVEVADEPPAPRPLLLGRVDADDVDAQEVR